MDLNTLESLSSLKNLKLAVIGHVEWVSFIAVDQLPDGFNINSQADFLTSNGIKDLIEEGKEIWKKESATGGLEAIRARSRIVEAEALLDPNGLGSFSTLEWLINQ